MYSCMIIVTIHCGIINQKFQFGMTRQPFKISYYQCFNAACRSMQLLRYFVLSVL